jgi:hypothetical protein
LTLSASRVWNPQPLAICLRKSCLHDTQEHFPGTSNLLKCLHSIRYCGRHRRPSCRAARRAPTWCQGMTAGTIPLPEPWRRPCVLPQELGAVELPGRAVNSSGSRELHVMGTIDYPSFGEPPYNQAFQSAIVPFMRWILYKHHSFLQGRP